MGYDPTEFRCERRGWRKSRPALVTQLDRSRTLHTFTGPPGPVHFLFPSRGPSSSSRATPSFILPVHPYQIRMLIFCQCADVSIIVDCSGCFRFGCKPSFIVNHNKATEEPRRKDAFAGFQSWLPRLSLQLELVFRGKPFVVSLI